MNLHELKPAKGSVKNRKRIARGQGSGHGGTSTRGHKGAKSRSGYKRKRHFEGGQMPLQMRLPKRGFTNYNRVEYRIFNLSDLQAMAEKYEVSEFDVDFLRKNGYIRKSDVVKILGSGELDKALTISAHAASKSAIEAVASKGGSIQIVD